MTKSDGIEIEPGKVVEVGLEQYYGEPKYEKFVIEHLKAVLRDQDMLSKELKGQTCQTPFAYQGYSDVLGGRGKVKYTIPDSSYYKTFKIPKSLIKRAIEHQNTKDTEAGAVIDLMTGKFMWFESKKQHSMKIPMEQFEGMYVLHFHIHPKGKRGIGFSGTDFMASLRRYTRYSLLLASDGKFLLMEIPPSTLQKHGGYAAYEFRYDIMNYIIKYACNKLGISLPPTPEHVIIDMPEIPPELVDKYWYLLEEGSHDYYTKEFGVKITEVKPSYEIEIDYYSADASKQKKLFGGGFVEEEKIETGPIQRGLVGFVPKTRAPKRTARVGEQRWQFKLKPAPRTKKVDKISARGFYILKRTKQFDNTWYDYFEIVSPKRFAKKSFPTVDLVGEYTPQEMDRWILNTRGFQSLNDEPIKGTKIKAVMREKNIHSAFYVIPKRQKEIKRFLVSDAGAGWWASQTPGEKSRLIKASRTRGETPPQWWENRIWKELTNAAELTGSTFDDEAVDLLSDIDNKLTLDENISNILGQYFPGVDVESLRIRKKRAKMRPEVRTAHEFKELMEETLEYLGDQIFDLQSPDPNIQELYEKYRSLLDILNELQARYAEVLVYPEEIRQLKWYQTRVKTLTKDLKAAKLAPIQIKEVVKEIFHPIRTEADLRNVATILLRALVELEDVDITRYKWLLDPIMERLGAPVVTEPTPFVVEKVKLIKIGEKEDVRSIPKKKKTSEVENLRTIKFENLPKAVTDYVERWELELAEQPFQDPDYGWILPVYDYDENKEIMYITIDVGTGQVASITTKKGGIKSVEVYPKMATKEQRIEQVKVESAATKAMRAIESTKTKSNLLSGGALDWPKVELTILKIKTWTDEMLVQVKNRKIIAAFELFLSIYISTKNIIIAMTKAHGKLKLIESKKSVDKDMDTFNKEKLLDFAKDLCKEKNLDYILHKQTIEASIEPWLKLEVNKLFITAAIRDIIFQKNLPKTMKEKIYKLPERKISFSIRWVERIVEGALVELKIIIKVTKEKDLVSLYKSFQKFANLIASLQKLLIENRSVRKFLKEWRIDI